MLGKFLRDVVEKNPETFRVFGPDETESNRLGDVLSVTDRAWGAAFEPTDENLAREGRVVEMLSEHMCQGWLEGYLLTGRHGLFNCYEAFIHIVDSMFNQHAKWLKVTRDIPWRRPVASLNYLLSSHVWRQDHNGFSHQDPGFIDHVVNKSAEVVRVYLPPDANTLLSVGDHCLRSRHYVNVIVAGKQPALQYLSMDEAIVHCTRGASIWEWASNDEGVEPDVVLGCAGDIPTLETLAAAAILRERLPELKVRVVNVVDLMRLQPESEHPHGLPDTEFDSLFTRDRPIVFAYHGYPWLIHRLTYRRANHSEPPRARLQGGGHHDDAVRHGDAERPRPLPPGSGRDRPGARTRPHARPPAPGAGRPPRCRRGHGRGSTARTTPRSPAGPGRTERSDRQRGLDEPEAPPRRGRRGAPGRRLRAGRRGRPPRRPRRLALRRADADRRRGDRRNRGAAAARALAQRAGARGHSRGAGGAPGRAARRGLRHRLPSHDPGRGGDLRDSAPLARGVGDPALRLPRARGRVGRGRGRRRARRRLPSRRRLLRDGRARRRVGGHDDGIHARWRACRWRRAPARSTPARCCTSSASGV